MIMVLRISICIAAVFTQLAHLRPACNAKSEIQHFECSDTIETCAGVFASYTRLPQVHV